MLTEDAERSRSHGLKKEVLQLQASLLEIPIFFQESSWNDYENVFFAALQLLKKKGVQKGVFGDINVEGKPDCIRHRQWAEYVCQQALMAAEEPLWQEAEEDLISVFLTSGIKAEIIAVKTDLLDKKYLGRPLTKSLMKEFKQLGIHPFGELGEYHTVVLDSPLFSRPLNLIHKEALLKDGYWFLDVDILE